MAESYIGYDAPSKDFGMRHAMSWLWNDWDLTDHAMLQKKIIEEGRDDVWDEIARHLLTVEPRFKDMPNPHWIVMGCVSQYIFEDIEYFCNTHWQTRDPKFMDRQEKLKAHNLGWIMAPRTLDRIEKEFDNVSSTS